MSELKTPLYEKHVALGGKMVPFAGYLMPVNYDTTIQVEHQNVRNNVGVFDVSHMGQFIIEGNKALDFIQNLTSNDASKLIVGQAQYTCLTNDIGGIVDDMLVYKLGMGKYMMVVNAANLKKDWAWVNNHNNFNALPTNASDRMGIIAIQGPNSIKVLQKITETDLAEIKYYHFEYGSVAGVKNVMISSTGYTGSGGFEIYANNEDLPHIWDAIFEAGKEFNIKPAGLGARDTLRLEMGFCLYGNDIDDTTSPIEAGLKWITKINKPENFPSKNHFYNQVKKGYDKTLVGFKSEGRRIPRHGYPILNGKDEVIGNVTSGTLSPTLDVPIGMGYVQKEYSEPGTKIMIDFERKLIPAEVVKLPFYVKD